MLKEGRIDVTSMILDSPQNPLGLGLRASDPALQNLRCRPFLLSKGGPWKGRPKPRTWPKQLQDSDKRSVQGLASQDRNSHRDFLATRTDIVPTTLLRVLWRLCRQHVYIDCKLIRMRKSVQRSMHQVSLNPNPTRS